MAKNTKMESQNEFLSKKNNDYNVTPCKVIFDHVKKPDHYLMCKSTNVYDDKWRVNVYSRRYVEGIEGNTISASYFVRFNQSDNSLQIIS